MTQIADCVEKAGLTTTIEKLPKGMQTHVGRESRASIEASCSPAVRSQRLMLARALYKGVGPILLFG